MPLVIFWTIVLCLNSEKTNTSIDPELVSYIFTELSNVEGENYFMSNYTKVIVALIEAIIMEISIRSSYCFSIVIRNGIENTGRVCLQMIYIELIASWYILCDK